MWPQIQTNQHPFGIRQIADDLADRFGQFPHQGRDRQDLVAMRQLRVFQQVDHFNFIASGQVLLTNDFLISKILQPALFGAENQA